MYCLADCDGCGVGVAEWIELHIADARECLLRAFRSHTCFCIYTLQRDYVTLFVFFYIVARFLVFFLRFTTFLFSTTSSLPPSPLSFVDCRQPDESKG